MYTDIEHLISYSLQKPNPFLLILEGLEDPRNFGAILRTAEAVGVDGVIIPKKRSVGITDVVKKTSTGAVDLLQVSRVPNIRQTITSLKKEGYWIVGLEADTDDFYDVVDYKLPLVAIIGSEGNGLSRLTKESCDFLVKIPMFGKISSLNASVAAGIFMYEVVRQRSQKQ